LLPDCHHTVEIGALEKWLDWQSMNVEAKSCPRCKTRISARLKRFKLNVWDSFADWNRIKGKMQKRNEYSTEELIMKLEKAEDSFGVGKHQNLIKCSHVCQPLIYQKYI